MHGRIPRLGGGGQEESNADSLGSLGNFQRSRRPVLFRQQGQVKTRGVVLRGSPLETPCLGWGAVRWARCLAPPEIQAPRRKAGVRHEPRGLGQQCRHREPVHWLGGVSDQGGEPLTAVLFLGAVKDDHTWIRGRGWGRPGRGARGGALRRLSWGWVLHGEARPGSGAGLGERRAEVGGGPGTDLGKRGLGA